MINEYKTLQNECAEDNAIFPEKKIKRLVEVMFSDFKAYSYLSDLEDIKEGDLVTVEGKFCNKVGKITRVLKSFKMPKFEMKWVEKILDTDISGEYFKCGDDLISYNSALTPEKFVALFAEKKHLQTPVIGEENLNIDLENFEASEEFIDSCVLEKGKFLFKFNYVLFISIKNGVGKAIVAGSEYYDIDFKIDGNTITSIACDCPCFGQCKHVAALLYKLKDIKKNLKDASLDNLTICERSNLLSVLSRACGKVKIEL